MMERQRILNIQNDNIAYSQLNRKMKNEIIKAKNNWLKEKCQKIEQLEQIHDTRNTHKQIKGLNIKFRNYQGSILTNSR